MLVDKIQEYITDSGKVMEEAAAAIRYLIEQNARLVSMLQKHGIDPTTGDKLDDTNK